MAENCHQPASFGKENMFFEDYFLGSLMSDVFLTDIEFFHMSIQYKTGKVHGLFGLG